MSRELAPGRGRNEQGQDLVEYALLAGFIAVLIGAMIPNQVVPALNCIYTKVNQTLVNFGAN